jgi:cytoskeletal protein RodZ
MAEKTEEAKKKTQPKKIKISIPWVVIVAAIILVLLGLFLIIVPGKGVPQCSSETCFDHEFSLCQPSEWKTSEDNSSAQIEYKIEGKASDSRCTVSFHTTATSDTSDVWITCNFDNKLTFFDAQTNALNSPKSYDCHKGQ